MLKKIEREVDGTGAQTTIKEAHFPAPFKEGLEFSSPARGTWNIVHTGMLIPESHQIFVCALGCLRGVVLTAAEMNAMDRYSSIIIQEENVLDGSMEELMIEGVSDILSKLKYRPRAILLFISCQHFFLAYDQQHVFSTLRERFSDIDFIDCYMIPTLRKSGLTPDQRMRRQLYRGLKPLPRDEKAVNVIGSNLPLSKTCELRTILSNNGYILKQLNDCQTYDDYLAMASSTLNLIYEPIALIAGEDLKERLGQEYLYLPCVFNSEQIEENYQKLVNTLEISLPDFTLLQKQADEALKHAKQLIGDTPIAIDYTFTFRILSFTRLLLEYGFCVSEIYAENFLPEEKDDFLWIQEHYPEILISSSIRPQMRFLSRKRPQKMLAIGQKAAYFTGTKHFVNVVESGGLYGYDGIVQIASLLEDAFLYEKEPEKIIQRKGYGCESCI